MIVVADSSPLIALSRIGRLELLRDLFGRLATILLEARRLGIVNDPAGIAQELRDNAGFWISDELMDVLR